MYIWKIDGLPDGVWVKSEQGTNYDLIPEGDSIRVMNIDSPDHSSFTLSEIDDVKSESNNIIIVTPNEEFKYELGFNSDDLLALNDMIDTDKREDYIKICSSSARDWLITKLDL